MTNTKYRKLLFNIAMEQDWIKHQFFLGDISEKERNAKTETINHIMEGVVKFKK